MNLLLLTLGNSDLQFNRLELEQSNSTAFSFYKDENGEFLVFADKSVVHLTVNRNYYNWFLLKESRSGSETLCRNIDHIITLLHFPLITPVIQYLKQSNIELVKIALIYTDQKDEKFRKSDTLFTKDIIKKWLLGIYPGVSFDEVGIDRVTDIDDLYPRFRNKVKDWRSELSEKAHVYLADQGGIDQINQSIRLQLLQAFKSRVHILQKAEETATKELAFPQLFIKDLIKQNIIKHVNDFDFEKVDDTLQPDSWVVLLCLYSAQRLALNNKGAAQSNALLIPALEKVKAPFTIPNWDWNNLDKLLQNKIKIRDLWIAAKIQYINNRYSEFLWRLFTIYENMYAEPLNDICQSYTLDKFYISDNGNKEDKNQGWENQLNEIDKELIPYLIKENIWLNNPNRYAYEAIFKFLFNKGRIEAPLTLIELDFIRKVLKGLASKRNAIAHNMSSISQKDLDKLLKVKENDFFALVDKWFRIEKMAEFDIYRNYILQHYD